MNKFFVSIISSAIFSLAVTGCASNQPSTETISEVIAVETTSDPMPTNLSISDDWQYLRFNLTREELSQLAAEYEARSTEEIVLSMPDCTPEDDIFHITITYDDIEQSIKLLEKHPEQQSINLIREMPAKSLADFEQPSDSVYVVYYLLTEDDILRLMNNLQENNSSTIRFHQRLDIDSDDIAEFEISEEALIGCLQILQTTGQSYVICMYQIEIPATL